MGNAQSDLGEQAAWSIIKLVPVVNVAYAPIRAMVYQGKGNNDEAKRSGLDMASATAETATMFIPGYNMAKGAITATRIAVRAGTMIAAGAAQGGVEYGVTKGKQEIDEGQISFGTPTEEARLVASYIPGVNLLFDAGRAAAGEKVEAADFVQSAMTTGAYVAPVPRDIGRVDRMARHPVPKALVPNAKGGQARLAKGNYVRSKKLVAQAGEAAQQGLLNASEEGVGRVMSKTVVASAVKPPRSSVDTSSTSGQHSEAIQLSGSAKKKQDAAKELMKAQRRGTTAQDVAVVAAVITLVAGGCYLLYRWIRGTCDDKEETQDKQEATAILS